MWVEKEEKQEIRAIVRILLEEEKIMQKQRECFLLHFYEGLSYREIAKKEGVHFTSVQESVEVCRYQMLRKKAQGFCYDFQILNHNIVFANVLRRKRGEKPLFPASSVFIFDETHQMIHAARQMYSYRLGQEELENLLIGIEKVLWNYPESKRELLVLYKKIEFEIQVEFPVESMSNIRRLMKKLDRVSILLFSNDFFKIRSSSKVVYDLEQIREKLLILLEKENFIYWLERTGMMKVKVCALPRRLHFLLYEDLWEEKKPYIFTSGTLSVN